MRTPRQATATVVATLAIGVVVTSPSTAETAQLSPTSVELTRLVKMNADNRPLGVATPEIRRLVAQAGPDRLSSAAGDGSTTTSRVPR
jgi:hypothetical protein